MSHLGKYLIMAGILLVIAGLVLWLSGDRLDWFGNLPGDIRIKRENFTFYFPLVTMILVSLALSLILWFVRRLF